jgi:hypothetical protein
MSTTGTSISTATLGDDLEDLYEEVWAVFAEDTGNTEQDDEDVHALRTIGQVPSMASPISPAVCALYSHTVIPCHSVSKDSVIYSVDKCWVNIFRRESSKSSTQSAITREISTAPAASRFI